jgi:hypothetical protein
LFEIEFLFVTKKGSYNNDLTARDLYLTANGIFIVKIVTKKRQIITMRDHHQQQISWNVFDAYTQLLFQIRNSLEVKRFLQSFPIPQDELTSESNDIHRLMNTWALTNDDERRNSRLRINDDEENMYFDDDNNNYQRPTPSRRALIDSRLRRKREKENQNLFAFNSPANYYIYHKYRNTFYPAFSELISKFNTMSMDGDQLYLLPNNIATSHLSLEQLKLLFGIFDSCSFKYNVGDSLIDVRKSEQYENLTKDVWLNMLYTERMKDVSSFGKYSKILSYLDVNPESCFKVSNMDSQSNTDMHYNELVIMAIRNVETDTEVMPVDHYLEQHSIENRRMLNTVIKVLFLLLYFMNSHHKDRHVRLYSKFIAGAFDQTVVDQMLFVIYMIHIGTKCHLLKNNPYAVQFIQSELVKSFL